MIFLLPIFFGLWVFINDFIKNVRLLLAAESIDGLNCPGNRSRILFGGQLSQCRNSARQASKPATGENHSGMFQHLGAGLKVVTNLPKNNCPYLFSF